MGRLFCLNGIQLPEISKSLLDIKRMNSCWQLTLPCTPYIYKRSRLYYYGCCNMCEKCPNTCCNTYDCAYHCNWLICLKCAPDDKMDVISEERNLIKKEEQLIGVLVESYEERHYESDKNSLMKTKNKMKEKRKQKRRNYQYNDNNDPFHPIPYSHDQVEDNYYENKEKDNDNSQRCNLKGCCKELGEQCNEECCECCGHLSVDCCRTIKNGFELFRLDGLVKKLCCRRHRCICCCCCPLTSPILIIAFSVVFLICGIVRFFLAVFRFFINYIYIYYYLFKINCKPICDQLDVSDKIIVDWNYYGE